MIKRIVVFTLAGIILVVGLSACTRTVGDITVVTPKPIPSTTATDLPKFTSLSTPYAQEPAAGICAGFEGIMVTVTIYPDIPDPRCLKVNANQKLTVVNQTQGTIEVTISRFTTSIDPGAQTIVETPFGDYLAPGVHQLAVSPCCGAEIWLEENK